MPGGVRRRLAAGVLALTVAAAGALGLISAFSARDSSDLFSAPGRGLAQSSGGDVHLAPGSTDPVYPTNPPSSGPHVVSTVLRDGVPLSTDQLLSALERGNVVLVYGDPRQAPALRALATSVAGPFTRGLAAAGQAVLLDPLSTAPRKSVIALAWGHAQRASGAHDRALATFASYWLGRGAPGAAAR